MMTDQSTSGDGQPDPTGEGGSFTQEQVDSIVANRLHTERQKFADYDELKQAAERLTELEASQQTDLERATARAEQAEQRATDLEGEVNQLRIDALKERAAATHGVPAARIQGETAEEIDADAVKLRDEMQQVAPATAPKASPQQGRTSPALNGDRLLRDLQEKVGVRG